jgi:hypothetical protein
MPNAPGTPQTKVRFTAADKAKIEAIRSARRLPTVASVLRKLIDDAYDAMTQPTTPARPRAPKERKR